MCVIAVYALPIIVLFLTYPSVIPFRRHSVRKRSDICLLCSLSGSWRKARGTELVLVSWSLDSQLDLNEYGTTASFFSLASSRLHVP